MNKKDVFLGLVGGVCLTALVCYALMSANKSDPKDLSLAIQGPRGMGSVNVAINSTNKPIDYEVLLKQLFSNELMREGVIKWMGKNYQLYSIESLELAHALKTKACEPFPDSPVELRIQKQQECAAKPAVNELRIMANKGDAPFHSVGIKERIGIQSEEGRKPKLGTALVCNDGNYVNKKIVVVNNSDFSKEFLGSPGYLCPDPKQFPGLQLNPDDAKELFGSKLNKDNYALVYLGR